MRQIVIPTKTRINGTLPSHHVLRQEGPRTKRELKASNNLVSRPRSRLALTSHITNVSRFHRVETFRRKARGIRLIDLFLKRRVTRKIKRSKGILVPPLLMTIVMNNYIHRPRRVPSTPKGRPITTLGVTVNPKYSARNQYSALYCAQFFTSRRFTRF